MPRFYFHYRNRELATNKEVIAKDPEGTELPSLAEAREAALTSAREVVADNVKSASPHPLESIFITDETGREVMRIPAAEVLPLTTK